MKYHNLDIRKSGRSISACARLSVRSDPGLRLHFATLEVRHITFNWTLDHDVVGQAMHLGQWGSAVKKCGGKRGEVEKAIGKPCSPKVSGKPLRVKSRRFNSRGSTRLLKSTRG